MVEFGCFQKISLGTGADGIDDPALVAKNADHHRIAGPRSRCCQCNEIGSGPVGQTDIDKQEIRLELGQRNGAAFQRRRGSAHRQAIRLAYPIRKLAERAGIIIDDENPVFPGVFGLGHTHSIVKLHRVFFQPRQGFTQCQRLESINIKAVYPKCFSKVRRGILPGPP